MLKIKIINILFCVTLSFIFFGCTSKETINDEVNDIDEIEINEEYNVQQSIKEDKMILEVNGYKFNVTLEDNETVNELIELLKEESIVIKMSDYSGFEKVGPLNRTLISNDVQTITNPGDIVLYNSNQIVVFYGSNSWAYTRIGHVDDLNNWEDALGSGDTTITLSLE